MVASPKHKTATEKKKTSMRCMSYHLCGTHATFFSLSEFQWRFVAIYSPLKGVKNRKPLSGSSWPHRQWLHYVTFTNRDLRCLITFHTFLPPCWINLEMYARLILHVSLPFCHSVCIYGIFEWYAKGTLKQHTSNIRTVKKMQSLYAWPQRLVEHLRGKIRSKLKQIHAFSEDCYSMTQ